MEIDRFHIVIVGLRVTSTQMAEFFPCTSAISIYITTQTASFIRKVKLK